MSSDHKRRERFEAVFAEHYGPVLAYARRRAPAEVVQDVVAETFLVAWRRFDEIPKRQLPWLYGVARRVLANELRSARRRDALAERAAASIPASDPPAADPGLFEALNRLTEHDRELLLLVAWEGLAPADAAEVLGCSRPAVRVRLSRARKRLAAELEPDAEPIRPMTTTLEVER